MKAIITAIIICIASFILLNNSDAFSTDKKYTIVIHGGAGSMSKNMPDSLQNAYKEYLTQALNIGKSILENGGTALDAVEKVVNYLEDNPNFNAGKGAVTTLEGVCELDASIMSGKDLSAGAVAGVKHIKNPISLARSIMEKSPHVMFAGAGAEKFAVNNGVKLVDQSYFENPNKKPKDSSKGKGTVGCVALDSYGNLAAATSTGGMQDKMPGRVGDSPIINAGTYANNKTCAVSCTGHGELFIKNTVAYNLSALMEFKGLSLTQAADEMINNRLKPGDGGLIAVDKDGNYAITFNTTGMFHAIANSKGEFKVGIFK
ncbi:MAG TPA: isoaspartyl peptidase/L-asparaginase [Ignavibacteriaceae bacterium]|nr:isoaspartyl peptidase/L-asparaginase [Ignavibacteriaceae bacterium]